jgi:hypothetical protein
LPERVRRERLVLEGRDRPEDRVAAVGERGLELQALGDDRVDAVGRDEDVALLLASVGEARGHARVVLYHAGALAPEDERVHGRVGEDALEIRAGNGDVRRSEPARDVPALPLREQLPAATRVLGALDLIAERLDLVGQTHLLQRAHAVRPDEESRADLPQLRRPLEDGRLDARPAQAYGSRQPADAPADDDHTRWTLRHDGLLLRPVSRRA